MANDSDTTSNDVHNLKTEVEYRTRLQEIGNKLNSATNLDVILIDLHDEILSLFDAQRMTVYVVDGVKRELVSRFKSGDEVEEIRIPVSPASIAGYAAFKQKSVNIENVYDGDAVSAVDKSLEFDGSWDLKTGFKTKQVMAHPIIFQKYLLGVIQLINHKQDIPFSEMDGRSLKELAKVFGIALYNQKRIATGKVTKFDHLLENHLITQKELNRAVVDARKQKKPVTEILMKEFKIPKKEIGESLSKFYKIPFIEYNSGWPIPIELLSGLKVPFMRNNVFVPLRMEGDKVMIAIDNPNDLQRIDQIKVLFQGQGIAFSIVLKDDILAFIKLFSTDEKHLESLLYPDKKERHRNLPW